MSVPSLPKLADDSDSELPNMVSAKPNTNLLLQGILPIFVPEVVHAFLMQSRFHHIWQALSQASAVNDDPEHENIEHNKNHTFCSP
jgi:hypothetical protein